MFYICDDNDGRSPLYWGAYRNHIGVFKLFYKYGVNLDGKNNKIRSPLQVAIREQHHELSSMLLQMGADPFYKTYSGNALHFAAGSGDINIIIMIFYLYDHNNNVNINVKNKYGDTPLHAAVCGDQYECVEFLLKNFEEIDVNAINDEGNTPLHIAYKYSSKQIIDLLIKHGANKNINNNNWYLPSEIPLAFGAVADDS